MKKAIKWFKSFKEGFESVIRFKFLGILEINIGYSTGRKTLVSLDVSDNEGMSSIYWNVWRFCGEFILNKTKE